MAEKLTLPDGRVLEVERMKPSRMLDVAEAAGMNSANRAWMAMAMAVCHVTSIADVPVPTPKTPDDVKSLADEIGFEGIAAVQVWALPATAKPGEDAEDAARRAGAKQDAEAKAIAGNS